MSNELANMTALKRQPPRKPDNDYLEFSTIFSMIWRNKLVVAAITLACLAIGGTYAVTATPVYQSNILIKVDVNDPSAKSIPASLSGIFDLKTAPSSELEILRSRSVVAKAVDNARLYISAKPRYFPLIGEWIARQGAALSTPGLLGNGGYAWGNESIEVSTFDVPEMLENKAFKLTTEGPGVYRVTYQDLVDFEGKVGVETTTVTPFGEIRLDVTTIDANQQTRFVLRRFAKEDAVEALQRTLVIGERGRQSGIISVGLEDSDPKVAAKILNEVGAQYIHQNVSMKSEEAERSLSFLEKQLPELKAAIDESEDKYNKFRNTKGAVDLGEEVKSLLQQSVQSQISLLELRQKRTELLTRFQPENPLVQGVDQQIRVATSALGGVNERFRKVPDTEQDLVRLTRDVKVNTGLYTSLLETAQQLRLVKASQVGSARLIDTAVQPASPVGPKRLLIAAASGAIGLLLGLVVALFRKAPVRAVNDHIDLVGVSVPVRVLVPHSERQLALQVEVMSRQKKLNVLAEVDGEDASIESLRIFCTTLQFSMQSARNNVIAIVGPTSGVGKSFISANLSALLANTGKRVLLIDADLRGGHLHRYFGLDRRAGLSELMQSQASRSHVVNTTVIKNLDFISSGTLPGQPADILASGPLAAVLEDASRQYDYVVIDTAPVLAVADSLIVSQHAGMVFCVVRKGKSTAEQVTETAMRFERSGNLVTGLIFNDAKVSDFAYGYRTDHQASGRAPLLTGRQAL
jgi:tyrosine-protein kinase Etk/Wzc